jgi:hypothetical protein
MIKSGPIPSSNSFFSPLSVAPLATGPHSRTHPPCSHPSIFGPDSWSLGPVLPISAVWALLRLRANPFLSSLPVFFPPAARSCVKGPKNTQEFPLPPFHPSADSFSCPSPWSLFLPAGWFINQVDPEPFLYIEYCLRNCRALLYRFAEPLGVTFWDSFMHCGHNSVTLVPTRVAIVEADLFLLLLLSPAQVPTLRDLPSPQL